MSRADLRTQNCYNEGQSGTPLLSQDRYAAMSNALNSTGRNFTYSLCNWGDDKPWEWASTIANSARISGDIFDSFTQPTTGCPCDQDAYYCELPGYQCHVMNILGKASYIVSKNQPGYWNGEPFISSCLLSAIRFPYIESTEVCASIV